MGSKERIQTFKEFWPYYVMEHSKEGTRLLHFIGSSIGIACLINFFITRNGYYTLGGLIAGYGLAWIAHFGIEKNRPATFKYPLWSFVGDWKMWALTVIGKMPAEVERSRKIRSRI